MNVDDQRATNALYLALRESQDILQNTAEEDLMYTAFWLFHRMKTHYDGDGSSPKHHESTGH